MLQTMIASQMSHTKLNTNQLWFDFKQLKKPVSELVLEFLSPFYHSFNNKKLNVLVSEANKIPSWICSDWEIYK